MAVVEFSELQKDAIAEVMNISMGNAATAASELLNAKVWITTPRVSIKKALELRNVGLEPAVCVKIVYIKGISGTNLMVLKQDDVQLILNQLMGQPLVVTPDFEFDELNISAVSEVMNQMMGSSATALSNFLGLHIDISTPTPYIMEEINLTDIQDCDPEDDIVAVNFDLTIEGVIKSEFVSVMSIDLAKMIAEKILTPDEEPEPTPKPTPAPAMKQSTGAQQNQTVTNVQSQQVNQMPQTGQMNQMPQNGQIPPYNAAAGYDPAMMGMMQAFPNGAFPGGVYPGMTPYGYGIPAGYGYSPYAQPINIQNATLHQFEGGDVNLSGEQKENLQLLMGVPLQISVEIGTARRKVKDILDFTQGTIIELERQAGAPVDVVVNGNLIARGDVVVMDDNFAVRITEIIKSKFMDSLGKE